MKTETLEKANQLNRQIREFNEALNCFEWQPYCDDERKDIRLSTNPQLIVEFDGGDGREEIKLPMVLNNTLIEFLKDEIKSGLNQATEEFENL